MSEIPSRVKLEAFYCTGFASPTNLQLNRTTHSAFVARFAHQPKPGAPGAGVLSRFTYMLQTAQSQSRAEPTHRLTIPQLVHNTYMPQICFPFALLAPMRGSVHGHTPCTSSSLFSSSSPRRSADCTANATAISVGKQASHIIEPGMLTRLFTKRYSFPGPFRLADRNGHPHNVWPSSFV